MKNVNQFFGDGFSEKKVAQIASLLGKKTDASKEQQLATVVSTMFFDFLKDVVTPLVHEKRVLRPQNKGFQMSVDYDPGASPENTARFIKESWDKQAKYWSFIETIPTYQITMATLMEKFIIPKKQEMLLVSLGSGPGIYEAFLAFLFNTLGISSTVTTVDFAPEMSAINREILNRMKPRPFNTEVRTCDMTSMDFLPDGCADSVLCNNSLQWCIDWKKAIKEIARILNPKSIGAAYFFIHTHQKGMSIFQEGGKTIVSLPVINPDEFFDELENSNLEVGQMRQICGGQGTGQMGGSVNRLFVRAVLRPNGINKKWRERNISLKGGSLYRLQGHR